MKLDTVIQETCFIYFIKFYKIYVTALDIRGYIQMKKEFLYGNIRKKDVCGLHWLKCIQTKNMKFKKVSD